VIGAIARARGRTIATVTIRVSVAIGAVRRAIGMPIAVGAVHRRRRAGREGRRAVMAMPIEQPLDEAAVIVDHMLEIPALLLVEFVCFFGMVRERLFVFVHEASVTDIGAGVAERRMVATIASVAAIAATRFVDEAVVLAMPAF